MGFRTPKNTPRILDPVEHPLKAAGEAQRLIDRLRLCSNDAEHCQGVVGWQTPLASYGDPQASRSAHGPRSSGGWLGLKADSARAAMPVTLLQVEAEWRGMADSTRYARGAPPLHPTTPLSSPWTYDAVNALV